jgi:O-antigen ligase
MNYLELLYKQGLPGIGFWLVLLYINFMAFRSIERPKRQQALPFFLAAVFVYFATATNTFLTGSIGMSVVLMSTAVLLTLNKEQQKLCRAELV